MEQKQIITIVVAAIIIIAAAVAVVKLSGNKDNNGSGTFDTDATVLVYGNANNDGRIDSKDVDFIQSIVDKKTSWNKEANPFADADGDGDITAADVELVKKIINNEKATVYYQNYFGEKQAVNYPLVNNRIAVTYWQQAEAVSILGHWDEVVVASRAAVDVYPDLYPSDNVVPVGTTGSSSKAVEDLEVFTENKVDLIIATASTAVKTALDGLSGTDIQVIYLWHSGPDVVSTILTLGVLMDSEDKAEAYAQFYDETVSSVKDVVDNISDKPGIVANITYSNTEERMNKNGGITVMLSDREGAYYLLSMLGNVMSDPDAGEWGYAYKDLEWFMENDSKIDFIINCEASIGFNTGSTKDAYNERFETNAEIFNFTTAYKEGKVIGSVYAFLGGFSGCAMLPLLASMIYPDQFDMDDALDTLQHWFDTFTDADVDVNNWGAYYYTGTSYDIWYNRK